MRGKTVSLPPVTTRVVISLALPLAGFLVASIFVGRFLPAGAAEQAGAALPLAVVGLITWFLGLHWYGLPEMGLRGHRPLYASIGFAVLGWLAFLAVRFVTVAVRTYAPGGTGQTFIYLLLFEAFSAQLWTFGLFFRTTAEWRGPLTAAVSSGLLFGLMGFLIFQESFLQASASVLYFLIWGVFYGLIRLRTGSLLGIVVVQAMQSLTAWHVMAPFIPPDAGELLNLYLISGLFYLLFIWRLWPKQEEDYRI